MAAEKGIRAEQDVEERLELEQRRRDAEGFERALRKRLSVRHLLTMHKKGRLYSHETLLELVELY